MDGGLVQSNYGGVLQIMGAPVGQELGRHAFQRELEAERGDGSIIIVVATDALLTHRNLRRLAERAVLGLGRTGASGSHGLGDYVIAFSTAPSVRRPYGAERLSQEELGNDAVSPLFAAVVEATAAAIYNSLFMATTVQGNGQTVEALPLARVLKMLQRHGIGPAGGQGGG